MDDNDKPNIDALLDSTDTNRSVIEIDNYICQVCEWGENIDRLSASQKVFYFNQELEREINNGGFGQYFLNSSGAFAHETIASLNAVGATHTAGLLQRAIDEFPDGSVPRVTEVRGELMSNLWPESSNEVWEELDQKFFAYEDDLNALNMAYVKANRDSF